MPALLANYLSFGPVKGESVPSVAGSVGPEEVLAGQCVNDTVSARSSGQPGTDHSGGGVEHVLDDHGSAREENSHYGDVFVLVVDVGDHFLVELFEVKSEALSLFYGEVGVADVVVEAADAAEDSLVDAVGHAHVSLELGIGGLAEHCQNDGVAGGHVLAHVLEVVQVGGAFQIDA